MRKLKLRERKWLAQHHIVQAHSRHSVSIYWVWDWYLLVDPIKKFQLASDLTGWCPCHILLISLLVEQRWIEIRLFLPYGPSFEFLFWPLWGPYMQAGQLLSVKLTANPILLLELRFVSCLLASSVPPGTGKPYLGLHRGNVEPSSYVQGLHCTPIPRKWLVWAPKYLFYCQGTTIQHYFSSFLLL